MADVKKESVTRGRMFLLVLFKSLKIRKNRVAITFFSIMIGASVITALSSVYFDISAKMSRELRAYGANFFIGPKAGAESRTTDAGAIREAAPPRTSTGWCVWTWGTRCWRGWISWV